MCAELQETTARSRNRPAAEGPDCRLCLSTSMCLSWAARVRICSHRVVLIATIFFVRATLCRIGTEHEKLGFNLKDNSRITYEQIEKVLRRLEDRFGWEPMMEAGRIIGVSLDGQSVTLEPGGQFELSGAPVDSIHKTCAEVNSHLYQVGFWSCTGACMATQLCLGA